MTQAEIEAWQDYVRKAWPATVAKEHKPKKWRSTKTPEIANEGALRPLHDKILEILSPDAKMTCEFIAKLIGVPRHSVAVYIAELESKGLTVRENLEKNRPHFWSGVRCEK